MERLMVMRSISVTMDSEDVFNGYQIKVDMRKKCVVWAVVLCGAISSHAQVCQPEGMAFRVKEEAFNRSQVEELSQFMTDELGPRLAGSQMSERAERLVVDRLKEWGLANPRTEVASEYPKGGWDNEKNYVAMTFPYYCSFAANPKAWSGSTDGLVKGECMALDVKTKGDLEKYRGKLAGKIVLMPVQQEYQISYEPLASRYTDAQLQRMTQDRRPGKRRQASDGENWKAMQELQHAVSLFLKSENVLAVVCGGGTFNVPTSRRVEYKIGDSQPVPEIILPIEDHGRMVRLLNRGQKVEMELDIQNRFTETRHVNNVIAEIPGCDSKLKNEVVLIGAHLDSWHGGTGGADNASGCIVMMEAMRILRALGISPRRTIRLALWGAEEQGYYGSRGYASTYLYDLKKGSALPGYDQFALYLNMDFGSGRFRGVYLEENDQAVPFFETWMKPFKSLGFTTLSPFKVGSTDHVSFSVLGLPAYQFIQDPLEYDRTYHTTMDTYERLSLEDLKVNAAIVAWLALNAAMDDNRIPAKPGYPEAYSRR